MRIQSAKMTKNDGFFKSVTFSNVRSLNYSPPFSNQTSKYKIERLLKAVKSVKRANYFNFDYPTVTFPFETRYLNGFHEGKT